MEDNWMVRFDNNGLSYNNFQWKPIGKWTEAPDWNPKPVCGGGLHGQGPDGFGYCLSGNRFVFCKTGITNLTVVNDNKIKTKRAKIISINNEAFKNLLKICHSDFLGSLDLNNYRHPLPKEFTHCGGFLNLSGYTCPLPKGFTHCDGDLDLEGYTYPLPEGFTHCGGNLYLKDYIYPLPKRFVHCGRSLYLKGYTHPLPKGLVC